MAKKLDMNHASVIHGIEIYHGGLHKEDEIAFIKNLSVGVRDMLQISVKDEGEILTELRAELNRVEKRAFALKALIKSYEET